MRTMIRCVMSLDSWNKPLLNNEEDEAYNRYKDVLRLREEEERQQLEKKKQQRCAC